MDGDGQEDSCGNRLGPCINECFIVDLLPCIEPFQNLRTSGHLIIHQPTPNCDERSAHLLSFFLELFAKGYVVNLFLS
jgi:hypothetical protein